MSWRERRVAALLLCCSQFVACSVGPEFRRPETATAGYFRTIAAPAAEEYAPEFEQRVLSDRQLPSDWWTTFNSDELNDVVQRALSHNFSLEAAAATLARSAALTSASTGVNFPRIDLNSGVGRQQYGSQFLGGLAKIPAFTYFSLGAAVSYALDFTGGTRRSIEQQDALQAFQQHQLDAARLATAGGAATLAIRIASLGEQIETMDELLVRDRENLRLIQASLDAGAATELDVTSARSQLAEDMTSLPPLRKELRSAQVSLAVLMGAPPAVEEVPTFMLSRILLPRELPIGVPSELAHRRPDILAAEAQLHAATAAVGVASSRLYPRVTLTASAGQQAVRADSLFDRDAGVWSLAGGLTAPLFDGGALRAERHAALESMRASAANYRQTVLTAFGQVTTVLAVLQQDDAELAAQQRADAAARDAVDLTRRGYREGEVAVLQVLDAERRYQRARLGYVKAVAQRYLDTVQLFLALGVPP